MSDSLDRRCVQGRGVASPAAGPTRRCVGRPGPDLLLVVLLLLPLLVVVPGCRQRSIRVDMRAGEGQVDRTFETNDRSAVDAAALERMYGSAPRRQGERVRVDGRFGNELPSELGNRNGVAELPSELGTASFYFESFGRALDETHDEWRHLQARMAAGELWVRLFGRWGAGRINDSARRAEFERYVESTLVPAANNVMLMYGSMQATAQSHRVGVRLRDEDEDGERTEEEAYWLRLFIPLLLNIAVEGDGGAFLTAEETQLLFMVASDGRVSRNRRSFSIDNVLLRAVLREVQRFRPDVTELTMPQLFAAGISFYLYAVSSPDRTDLLLASPAISEADKARLRDGHRFITLPPPYGVLPRGRPESTQARVDLTTGARPYLSNGRWDSTTSTVVFDTAFFDSANRTVIYQPIYYAAWSTPAVDRQQRLFGRVLLQDQALADYCLWEEMLSTAERIEWSEALLELERDGRSFRAGVFILQRPQREPPPPLGDWVLSKLVQHPEARVTPAP